MPATNKRKLDQGRQARQAISDIWQDARITDKLFPSTLPGGGTSLLKAARKAIRKHNLSSYDTIRLINRQRLKRLADRRPGIRYGTWYLKQDFLNIWGSERVWEGFLDVTDEEARREALEIDDDGILRLTDSARAEESNEESLDSAASPMAVRDEEVIVQANNLARPSPEVALAGGAPQDRITDAVPAANEINNELALKNWTAKRVYSALCQLCPPGVHISEVVTIPTDSSLSASLGRDIDWLVVPFDDATGSWRLGFIDVRKSKVLVFKPFATVFGPEFEILRTFIQEIRGDNRNIWEGVLIDNAPFQNDSLFDSAPACILVFLFTVASMEVPRFFKLHPWMHILNLLLEDQCQSASLDNSNFPSYTTALCLTVEPLGTIPLDNWLTNFTEGRVELAFMRSCQDLLANHIKFEDTAASQQQARKSDVLQARLDFGNAWSASTNDLESLSHNLDELRSLVAGFVNIEQGFARRKAALQKARSWAKSTTATLRAMSKRVRVRIQLETTYFEASSTRLVSKVRDHLMKFDAVAKDESTIIPW